MTTETETVEQEISPKEKARIVLDFLDYMADHYTTTRLCEQRWGNDGMHYEWEPIDSLEAVARRWMVDTKVIQEAHQKALEHVLSALEPVKEDPPQELPF